jgi:hypothetical protein
MMRPPGGMPPPRPPLRQASLVQTLPAKQSASLPARAASKTLPQGNGAESDSFQGNAARPLAQRGGDKVKQQGSQPGDNEQQPTEGDESKSACLDVPALERPADLRAVLPTVSNVSADDARDSGITRNTTPVHAQTIRRPASSDGGDEAVSSGTDYKASASDPHSEPSNKPSGTTDTGGNSGWGGGWGGGWGSGIGSALRSAAAGVTRDVTQLTSSLKEALAEVDSCSDEESVATKPLPNPQHSSHPPQVCSCCHIPADVAGIAAKF